MNPGAATEKRRITPRAWGRKLAIAGAVVAALAFTVVWLLGSKLVAPVNRIVGPPPAGLPIETLKISSESGSEIAAWYLEHPNATSTIVLLHPIRADRRAMLSRAALLYNNGYSSLLIDLQAHGETPGEAITFGYRERHDVTAAVQYIRARKPSQKVGVIGWSLGGAAALLASPLSIDALVIESVYPTIQEATNNRVSARIGSLANLVTPVLLSQVRPRLRISPPDLRPIEHADQVACPLLVVAGDLDQHTKIEETQRIYETANEPKELQIFPGAAHVDLLGYDAESYEEHVIGFLDEWLKT